MITTILQLLEVIKLAIDLFKKVGHEKAKQEILSIIEEKDDKKTNDYLRRILDE